MPHPYASVRSIRLRAFSAVLAGMLAIAGAAGAMPAAGGLKWIPFTSDAYSAAERSGSPFVVTFGAEWCAPCKEMEQKTYNDPKVIDAAHGMHLLYVDMTGNDDYVDLVRKSFKVFGAPTTVFFGTDRKERTRRIGYIPPEVYVELLTESRAPAPSAKSN